MVKVLSNLIPLLAILGTVAFGIWKHYKVERERLEWDRYERKAKIYTNILTYLEGFYGSADGQKEKKDEFLKALRLCELHCPDEIIKAGNAFLETVAVDANASDEEKERALAVFRLSLRRDLHPETDLSIENYRFWSSN